MSRNGPGRSLPRSTMRIWPVCCTMNRRPLPSPAPVAYSGESRPPTTGRRRTLTRAGSKAGRLALGVAEPVTLGEADPRAVTGAVVACPEPPEHETRTTMAPRRAGTETCRFRVTKSIYDTRGGSGGWRSAPRRNADRLAFHVRGGSDDDRRDDPHPLRPRHPHDRTGRNRGAARARHRLHRPGYRLRGLRLRRRRFRLRRHRRRGRRLAGPVGRFASEPLSDPLRALERCVGDPDQLMNRYSGPGALHRPSGDPRGFDDLLSYADVDHIVSSTSLRTPAFRSVKGGKGLPTSAYTRTARTGSDRITGVADPAAIYREFEGGATIVLQGLHRYWLPLARFCRDLELALGHPVQVNAYITPPGSQGLAVHSDEHDVFVLQV